GDENLNFVKLYLFIFNLLNKEIPREGTRTSMSAGNTIMLDLLNKESPMRGREHFMSLRFLTIVYY
ncbi:hypothetical protein, partial [Butyribacter intestini]|uniref:hypothetical protein n=1 Tax=Butyribacter intestini TaxID=1703332 RepID=UPI003AF04619